MATTLQRQLAALQNPEFVAGQGKGRHAGKQRPSFLFDPKVAATYDLDTMYNIGCNGFAELVQIDDRFTQWETPLFSEAARDTDRVTMDQAFNKKLDKALHGMLVALSPHFLLKPVGKVLEWLIRRFRINEFNIESVIACILPYYETKQFTQMLTTFAFEKCPQWAFLERVVETAKPMDRHFFLRRLFSEPALVRFVCNTVQERVQRKYAFSTAFTFYATTLILYVTKIDQITANTATLLMPYLTSGLASTNKEWRLSNYLVLCQLGARTSLSEPAMETILSTVVKHAGSEVQQAMLTLVCLSQSQQHFPTKSAALVDLVALPNALAYMAAVTKAYKSIAFFRALFTSLLAYTKTEQILALLSHPDLIIPHETVQMVATELLSAAMDASDADAAVMADVFQRLQGRYSRVLDAAVADFVATHAGDNAPKQDRKRVFHVVQQCLGGTSHALLENLGTTLFLALRHPEDAYCLSAVCHLRQNPTILANLVPDDVEPLAESLVAALDREDDEIAAIVLETAPMVEFLAKSVGNEFVHAVIERALKKPTRPAVAAVARVNATWAAGLTDASRQAATLFLIHAGATHAAWLKELSVTALTPTNDQVAALLATPEYAMTGLGLVTKANQTALFPAIVALIHDDREQVATAAVRRASAAKGTDMNQRVLCELFALPANRLAKYTGALQTLLQGKNAYELLVGGLAHETSAVVDQCLKHLARLVSNPSAPTDFQALIPYVFPCFMHTALSVRQHARQVLVAVLKHYKTAASAASVNDEAGSKKKKVKYQLIVFPPVGYAANAVLFVEPKVMHDWLVEVTETTDLTTSHEAVLHQTYRKKKRQVLTAFLSHMPHLRVALLSQWLKLLSLVDSPDVFLALHMHFRKRHAMLGPNSTQEDVAVIIQFIHCITPGVASQILQSDSLDTFKQFLNGYLTPDLERVQQATLTRITPDLFLSLSGEQQYELLYILLNIVSKSQVSDVVLEAKSVLKRIPISVHSLVQLFHKFHKNKDGQQGGHNAAGTGSNKRAANAAGGSGGGMPVRQRMSKLTSLLELISYKDVPDNDKLVQPLFSTLQYILNHPDYTQYDYIIQLVLADLLLVNKAALDESVFRVDLLVTCIRSTDNPQTHNSVLLVLSSLAALCPEKVLLHVMPIFTFMGAHVLRQDDEYTFNVIESTIEKIIPSLLLNVTHIKHVIQVFVDAIQHIPIHRRLRLFTTLIKTLGDQYLHAIIALLLEKEHVKLLEFCLLISSEFPVEAQLKAMIELVRMCCEETPDMDGVAAEAKAPVEPVKKRAGKRSANNKKAAAANDDSRLISLESLAKIKPPVLMFIDENLMMRSFISSLSKAKVETEVKLFVQELLTFVQRHAINKPVLRLAYGILDKVHHLLSLSTFISVISDLWRHPSPLIQKRAVTMFNDRVSHLSAATVQKYRAPLMATLPAVQWIFAERSSDPEMVQLGLMALQQLCTHFAAHTQHTATFMDAVPTILGYLSSGTAAAVTASAFVCLSHFIAQLTQRMVKYLNKWMAPLLAFMEANKHHPLNEISALTCVEQCVLHLHAFLPPFLPKVFACLFADRDLEATMANPQLDLLYTKMDAVAAQVASHMQMRHLLPALFNFTAKLVPGTNSVEHVVRFGKHVVAALKRDDIKQYHGDLFAKYFLVLLDQTPYTPTAIAALVDLVMKLNENLFKPMFGHMLRWLREQPQRRGAVFFHTQAYMFDHLKNLLVGYMALALDDALAVLKAARAPGADTTAAAHVLDALHKCALYDTAKVVEAHLEPVTAGVAATLVVPALAPAAAKALVQIAVTVNSDAHWKTVNTTLLEVARGDMFDNDETVSNDMALDARRAAVGTLGTLFETIGEGYLVLLPETIPTIAECLEDEELETATTTAVRQIEEVLGEPLQKYLQK
ncbi:HEAT repeat-containing protein 1 [Allomyces arbusculus]|nr:HEAT repeat-containing protein 1 [Allomyces arbusculus]